MEQTQHTPGDYLCLGQMVPWFYQPVLMVAIEVTMSCPAWQVPLLSGTLRTLTNFSALPVQEQCWGCQQGARSEEQQESGIQMVILCERHVTKLWRISSTSGPAIPLSVGR